LMWKDWIFCRRQHLEKGGLLPKLRIQPSEKYFRSIFFVAAIRSLYFSVLINSQNACLTILRLCFLVLSVFAKGRLRLLQKRYPFPSASSNISLIVFSLSTLLIVAYGSTFEFTVSLNHLVGGSVLAAKGFRFEPKKIKCGASAIS